MKSILQHILILLCFLQGTLLQAQWTTLTSPANLVLDRASFPSSQRLFIASSTYSKVYRSNDGGMSWDSISFPSTIIDIQFLNDDTGFVLYNDSPNHPLSVTTNGGDTWTDVMMTGIGPFENIQRMKFTDFATGHFVNYNGEILRTTDQGATVTNHPLGAYGYINDVENRMSDTLIMSGWDGTFNYQGAIFRSFDGGMNWQSLIHDSLYSTYTGTHFLNGHHGYVVYQQGWSGINSRIGISMNGGLSWVTIGTDTVNTHQDIFMLNQALGYLTTLDPGGTGLILKTTDGTNWITDYTTALPVRKFLVGGSVLFGIGDGGTIIKNDVGIGINELNEIEKIGLNPNPSSGIVYLQLEQPSHLTVFNANGERVCSAQVNGNSSLDLTHLPNGIYTLRCGNEKGIRISKLVLAK